MPSFSAVTFFSILFRTSSSSSSSLRRLSTSGSKGAGARLLVITWWCARQLAPVRVALRMPRLVGLLLEIQRKIVGDDGRDNKTGLAGLKDGRLCHEWSFKVVVVSCLHLVSFVQSTGQDPVHLPGRSTWYAHLLVVVWPVRMRKDFFLFGLTHNFCYFALIFVRFSKETARSSHSRLYWAASSFFLLWLDELAHVLDGWPKSLDIPCIFWGGFSCCCVNDVPCV